jgi:YD repeat-containing protein
MIKNFTHFSCWLLCLILLGSCQEGNFRNPEPFNSDDCLLVKEFSFENKKRYLLNEYQYVNYNQVSGQTHYSVTGSQSRSQYEYDSQGRLIKVTQETAGTATESPAQYYVTYSYTAEGQLSEIKGYNLKNNREILEQHMLFFYNTKNQVDRIISSFGTLTRLVYDEKGNVIKVYFTPYLGTEYLKEEYLSYQNKSRQVGLETVLNLINIYPFPSGANFSQNIPGAYNIYNPDGSLAKTCTQKYEYDYFGKYTKSTYLEAGSPNGKSSKLVMEAEYKCR